MKGKRNEQRSTPKQSMAADFRSLSGDVWRDWKQRGDKDPEVLTKLTALFVQDTDQRLAALSESLAKGSASGCARAAHALTAGCLQIGATRMARYCVGIERAAQDEAMQPVPELLQCLQDEYCLVRRELEHAAHAAAP